MCFGHGDGVGTERDRQRRSRRRCVAPNTLEQRREGFLRESASLLGSTRETFVNRRTRNPRREDVTFRPDEVVKQRMNLQAGHVGEIPTPKLSTELLRSSIRAVRDGQEGSAKIFGRIARIAGDCGSTRRRDRIKRERLGIRKSGWASSVLHAKRFWFERRPGPGHGP